MYTVIATRLPFLRTDLARNLGARTPPTRTTMKGRALQPFPRRALGQVVDMASTRAMEDRDTKGDVSRVHARQIASAGQNGQFRTPRHIIRLMVELTAPQPTDVICDPACGTAGFLVAAGELSARAPLRRYCTTRMLNEHFHQRMFHGFDFDNTMLRIGSNDMLPARREIGTSATGDSLAQDHAGEEEKYTSC